MLSLCQEVNAHYPLTAKENMILKTGHYSSVRMPCAMKVMARINDGTVRIADMNTVQVNSVNANISVYRCGNVHIRNKTGQTIINSCTKRLRISNGSCLLNITGSIPQDTIAGSESGGIAVIINGHMMDSLVSLIAQEPVQSG